LVFTLGGKYADQAINSPSPWCTLTGTLLGSGIAIYTMIADLTR